MSPHDLDRAVIQRRLEQIERLLNDLASVGEVPASRLESDRMLRHAVERIMTQLVELATAINSHIAVSTFGSAPEDYRSSFLRCADAGAIPRCSPSSWRRRPACEISWCTRTSTSI